MTNQSPPWPKQGPASYFPSIETKYGGRSIAEWQKVFAESGLEKHMAIVSYLKSDYGMGTDTPTLSSAGRWRETWRHPESGHCKWSPLGLWHIRR